MPDKVRAKFRVVKIEHGSAVLQAVVGGSPEDNQFARATPWGELKMTYDNPNVDGFFEVNKAYYLDFTPAE